MSHGSQRMNEDNWNVEETDKCSESRDDGPNDDVHNISDGNEMETSQSLCMDVEGRNPNDPKLQGIEERCHRKLRKIKCERGGLSSLLTTRNQTRTSLYSN
ncbi:uncharacterized protein [Venturia canescens]|uniref:uncharacterized protein n=1 Tax=Venturia canescens TaxID=32260 RepID=UPI001C9CAEAB|nr:uncharacterized protein LOC122416033 [Venturia canescens]